MKKKQKICMSLIALSLLLTIGKTSFANTVEESDREVEEQIVINTDNSLMPFETTSRKNTNYFLNAFDSLAKKIGASFPSSYRTEGLTVKNQGRTGECWAFSFTSAFEAKDIKAGAEKKIYSPRHMDFSCSKSFSDVADNSKFFERETTEAGGNYFLATAYAASGKGPVLESAMPFSEDVTTKISYGDLDIEPEKQLDKTIMFDAIYKLHSNGSVSYYSDSTYRTPYTKAQVDSIRNKVKQQIIDNGSVSATVYEADFEKDVCVTDAAQSLTGAPNHGILIVGWDDNYQGTNWPTKGAYIVLNSYGVENFDNGYIYVSYDDVFIERGLFGLAESSEIDYDKVYEHDPMGATNIAVSAQLRNTETDQYNDTEISAVNVFTRDVSKNEQLTEVGIYSFSYQKAEVYFTEEFQKNGELYLPINFKKVANLTDTIEPGFTTVQLQEKVRLTKDRFAICVRYVQDNAENMASVAVEMRESGTDWWNNVTGEVGETFFIDVLNPTGANKYWVLNSTTSEGEVYYRNASIKAYTKEIINTSLNLSAIDYSVNNTDKVIAKIPASTSLDIFKTKITANQEYKILDKNNNEVTSGEMKTGYKVKFDTEEYVISVIGDINGDGLLNILDLARMRAHLVGRKGYILSGIYLNSADISGNGEVDILDLARMRKECLK